MQQIFDFFRTLIIIISGFVDGIWNLVQTAGSTIEILGEWLVFVPHTVASYIIVGVMVTVILVIFGRANK